METLGLAVSGISLLIALWGLYASRRAQSAAEQAKSLLGQNAAIADLTQAIEQIQSLKELHATRQWERARDRYTPLRQLIQAARQRHPGLSTHEQEQLQTAIILITSMENEVGSALYDEKRENDTPRLFETLNDIQMNLEEVSSALANEYEVGEKT